MEWISAKNTPKKGRYLVVIKRNGKYGLPFVAEWDGKEWSDPDEWPYRGWSYAVSHYCKIDLPTE